MEETLRPGFLIMLKTQRLSMLAEERHQVSVLACDQGSNENKPCKTEHIYVEDRMIQLLIQNYIEYSNRKFHLAKSTERDRARPKPSKQEKLAKA